MENEVFKSDEFRKRLYLSEFEFFDGEYFITFNIVDINTDRKQITVAVTNVGRISVITYDLMTDKDGKLYFEYGQFYEKVAVDDFEEV
jgi:major membrane immunogen (membrane-anchored lipoprotein)